MVGILKNLSILLLLVGMIYYARIARTATKLIEVMEQNPNFDDTYGSTDEYIDWCHARGEY